MEFYGNICLFSEKNYTNFVTSYFIYLGCNILVDLLPEV